MRRAVEAPCGPEKAGIHMRSTGYVLAVVSITLMCSATASAQSVRPAEWSHATTLSGFAGGAADGTRAGPSLGGGAGWEVTPRFALDATGAWTTFGAGADAFSASMRLRVRLAGHRTVDPFVQGGVGLYRAMFESSETELPEFYRRRVDPLPGGLTGMTFTDPTLVTGGGVSIFLTRHFALRPEAEVTFVLRDGSHVLTSFLVHAVFHFEEHPVTPTVRR